MAAVGRNSTRALAASASAVAATVASGAMATAPGVRALPAWRLRRAAGFATAASEQPAPAAAAQPQAGEAAATQEQSAASPSDAAPPPSVRMLAEAGIIVSPVRAQDGRKHRRTRQRGVTQQLLSALDRAEASAAAADIREGRNGTTLPSTTGSQSPLSTHVSFPVAYRRARAKLWVPTATQAGQTEEEQSNIAQWLQARISAYASSLVSQPEKQAAFHALSHEEQLDFALLDTWQALSQEEQDTALLRTRFDSIRKLGWRRGFSAGFPSISSRTDGASGVNPDDADLVQQLQIPTIDGEDLKATRKLIETIHTAKDSAEVISAQRQLFQLDETRAWASWQDMPEAVRIAEEREAWTNRDRSRVYIDKTPGSSVCLQKATRWFAEPQRAGPLNFLPNIIVRLVRNYTPPGQAYDVWKATFRVPLSMHKHALRSYLLSIYGLRTTWSRSMIYRSKLTRSVRHGGGLRPGKDRTFKKVEVGLLEPFLWPGVDPNFLQNRMLVQEMKVEAQRAYLKMTRTARWRARRAADPMHRNIEEGLQHGSLSSTTATRLSSTKPIVLTKGGGIPTAHHGRILSMLLQKKRDREAEIKQIVERRLGS